jgi:hypothetical protein
MARLDRLRIALGASVGGLIALLLALAPWKIHLTFHEPNSKSSFILSDERAPVWNPPALPPRQRFEEEFPDIPATGGVVEVELLWEEMILDMLLGIWPISIVFAILYRSMNVDRADRVFEVCTALAWTFPAFGAVCAILWCLVGGWGPPALPCFIVLAVASGVFVGLLRRRRPAVHTGGTFRVV